MGNEYYERKNPNRELVVTICVKSMCVRLPGVGVFILRAGERQSGTRSYENDNTFLGITCFSGVI